LGIKDLEIILDSKKGNKRSQAAIEYIITYSWAILIIGLVVAFIFFYLVIPKTIVPPSCSFDIAMSCSDLVIGTNIITHSTTIALLLSNQQTYPIENPQLAVNVNGTNSTLVNCLPNYVLAGGVMLCQKTLPLSTTLGAFVGGQMYLNASYCGFVSGTPTPSSCSSIPQQTYPGKFSSHAEAILGNSITVYASSNAPVSSALPNTNYSVYGTVDLLGYPLKGATVNFTENTNTVRFGPEFVITNSTGTAQAYIASNSAVTVTFVAHFAGYSASNTIHFT
jgi:hypothetical protein